MLNPEPTATAPAPPRCVTLEPGAGLPVAACSAAPPGRIASAALLGGARELEIQHGDAVYRLRVTALGKLILTK